MVLNLEKKLKKINLETTGLYLFWSGIFLLPSAFFFAAIFLLLSLIISLFKSSSNIFKDKWNYFLIATSLFMIMSSTAHLGLFSDGKTFFFNSKEIFWDPSQSWIGLGNWIPLFLCFVGFQKYLSSPFKRKVCAKILIAGSFPVLISGFGQYWFNWYGPIYLFNDLIIWFQKPISAGQGMSGLFNNQNYAGCWLNIIWPFSLASIFERNSTVTKKLIVILLGIAIALALFLTSSRSAWGGFLLSSSLLLGSNALLIILLFIFLIIIFLFFNNIFPEFNNLPDNLNIIKQFDPAFYTQLESKRWFIFDFCIKMITSQPIFGWGAAVFPLYYASITNLYIGHPHNLFLEIAFSYGIIPALILFHTFLMISYFSYKKLFSRGSKIFKFDKYFEKAWWVSFFILLCTQMIDIQYFDGRISLAFWILLAGMRQIINNASVEENSYKELSIP